MVTHYKGSAVCSHKATPLFSVGGINFYAQQHSSITTANLPNKTLVLNNGAYSPVKPAAKASPIKAGKDTRLAFLCDAKYARQTSNVDEIHVAWVDFGVPPVGRDYWEYVWANVKEQGYKAVLSTCTGGHGRTGTALAAMIAVACNMSGSQAVNYVREKYCPSAIETKGQEDYLCSLFGGNLAEIKARASK